MILTGSSAGNNLVSEERRVFTRISWKFLHSLLHQLTCGYIHSQHSLPVNTFLCNFALFPPTLTPSNLRTRDLEEAQVSQRHLPCSLHQKALKYSAHGHPGPYYIRSKVSASRSKESLSSFPCYSFQFPPHAGSKDCADTKARWTLEKSRVTQHSARVQGRPWAKRGRNNYIIQFILLRSQDKTLHRAWGKLQQCSNSAPPPVPLLLYIFLPLSRPGHGDLGSWPALIKSKRTKLSEYTWLTVDASHILPKM